MDRFCRIRRSLSRRRAHAPRDGTCQDWGWSVVERTPFSIVALPCLALPCPAVLCLALPCPVLPCPALPRLALPCHSLQCLLACLPACLPAGQPAGRPACPLAGLLACQLARWLAWARVVASLRRTDKVTVVGVETLLTAVKGNRTCIRAQFRKFGASTPGQDFIVTVNHTRSGSPNTGHQLPKNALLFKQDRARRKCGSTIIRKGRFLANNLTALSFRPESCVS